MAQHFRLSAASRTLSLKEIYKGGEEKAKAMFAKLRWPDTNGEPVWELSRSRGISMGL